MPLLGASPLALPEDADLTAAWQEPFTPADPAAASAFTRVVPGETYEQLLSANFAAVTGAVAGNRTAVAIVIAGGRIVAEYAAATSQGPSLSANYSVNGGGGVSYSSPGNLYAISLPPILLMPTWSLVLALSGIQPGDAISQIGLLMLRIPTGPARREPPPASVAVPLIV